MRAVKVEALNSCSAYRISEMSIARRCKSVGRHAVQQFQKVAGQARLVAARVDPPAVAAEVIPIEQYAGQRGQQALGDPLFIAEAALRLEAAQGRTAGPQHVHGMGAGRQSFQHVAQGSGSSRSRKSRWRKAHSSSCVGSRP